MPVSTKIIRRRTPRAPGFTLIETLVAISILTLAMGGLVTLTVFSLRTLAVQKDKHTAVKIATEGMEWVINKRDNNVQCLVNNCGSISDWKQNLVGDWKVDAAFPQRLQTNQSFAAYAPGDYICIEDTGVNTGKFSYCGNNPTKVLREHFDRRVTVTDIGDPLGVPMVQVDSTVSWNSPVVGSQSITLTEVLFGTVPSGIPSLVGYWKLDDGAGSLASDSSGNGTTGSLLGSPAPTWVTGRFGGALRFTGSGSTPPNNAVRAVTSAVLDNIPRKTVSFWTNIQSYPSTAYGVMVAKDFNGMGGWFINLRPDGKIYFFQEFVSSPPNGAWCTSAPLALGTWHHIALTYDLTSDANVPQIYFNGVVQALTTVSLPVGTAASDTPGDFLLNGFLGGQSGVSQTLDDVRIYNRILSPSEVMAIFNGS